MLKTKKFAADLPVLLDSILILLTDLVCVRHSLREKMEYLIGLKVQKRVSFPEKHVPWSKIL